MSEVKEEVKVTEAKRETWDINIFGLIKEEDIRATCSLIRANKDRLPVTVYIASNGGNVSAGLVILDVLESLNVPVTWIFQGFSASMAVSIAQNFNQLRLAYPHSRLMCHDFSFTVSGRMIELENQKLLSNETEVEMIDRYAKVVGMSHKEVKKKLFDVDVLMNTETALNLGENGLIDGIIYSDFGDGVYLCKTRHGLKVIDTFIHTPADLVNLPDYKVEK
ncbi:hypothetical protein D5W64_12465 [Salmonella enterica subsp. enterica serovar Saintpaul]|nr:hypothetical protein [Salmonella enterica subsp. enterica serovar Saintpaul]